MQPFTVISSYDPLTWKCDRIKKANLHQRPGQLFLPFFTSRDVSLFRVVVIVANTEAWCKANHRPSTAVDVLRTWLLSSFVPCRN